MLPFTTYYLNENCVVSRGYLYIVQYNGECIYKINLSNTVDILSMVKFIATR